MTIALVSMLNQVVHKTPDAVIVLTQYPYKNNSLRRQQCVLTDKIAYL